MSGKDNQMRKASMVNTGNGPGTAIAVLMVGLMAIGVVFVLLGGALYLNEEPLTKHQLSIVPARAVGTAETSR